MFSLSYFVLYFRALFIDVTAARFMFRRIYANFCFITNVDYFFLPMLSLGQWPLEPSIMKFFIDTYCRSSSLSSLRNGLCAVFEISLFSLFVDNFYKAFRWSSVLCRLLTLEWGRFILTGVTLSGVKTHFSLNFSLMRSERGLCLWVGMVGNRSLQNSFISDSWSESSLIPHGLSPPYMVLISLLLMMLFSIINY